MRHPPRARAADRLEERHGGPLCRVDPPQAGPEVLRHQPRVPPHHQEAGQGGRRGVGVPGPDGAGSEGDEARVGCSRYTAL